MYIAQYTNSRTKNINRPSTFELSNDEKNIISLQAFINLSAKQHLLDSGVPEDHIIEIALDDRANKGLRDPDVCYQYVKNSIKGNGQ